MTTSIIYHFLGQGAAADRPVTPDVVADALVLWWSQDTAELSLYDFDAAAWVEDILAGGVAGGVTYDNAASGRTSTNVQDVVDELAGEIDALVVGSAQYADALLELSGNIAGHTSFTNIPFDAVNHDDTWDPGDGGLAQRLWLGVNFTFATTDVDTTDNEITETGHGMVTGEGPVRFTSSTTLPDGMALATNYWIIRVDNDTFKVATSRANAIAGTAVDIIDQGTGTHTCDRNAFVIPSGATKARLSANIYSLVGDLSGKLEGRFMKEGAEFSGGPRTEDDDGGSSAVCNLHSARVNVTEGDRFTCQDFGGDPFTLSGGATRTWFAIEVW